MQISGCWHKAEYTAVVPAFWAPQSRKVGNI